MKRPEIITVGGRTYKILIDPTLQLREGYTGVCAHQKLEIGLLPRFISSQLDESLWHEIMHSINAVFLNTKLGEEDINALASGLTQVMMSIGIIFEWEDEAMMKESNNK